MKTILSKKQIVYLPFLFVLTSAVHSGKYTGNTEHGSLFSHSGQLMFCNIFTKFYNNGLMEKQYYCNNIQ